MDTEKQRAALVIALVGVLLLIPGVVLANTALLIGAAAFVIVGGLTRLGTRTPVPAQAPRRSIR